MRSRWAILAGGVAVQLAIGGVYAWSVFAKALSDPAAMGLSKVAAAVPFEVAIGMIFVGAFIGGRLQDARGPRLVALLGVAVYSVGVVLSSLATSAADLWLLTLGYGVLGGFGLGLAYIVPVALLQKWFPDKAALATGAAVAGFGFGAVLTAPVAQALIGRTPETPTRAFLVLGIAYAALGLAGASLFRNPPATTSAATTLPDESFTVAQALRTPQWYLLTATLALSVTAGISLISVAAASMSDVAGMSAAAAAAAVGALGLFNGGGRLLWAALSDRIGKTRALALILGLQGAALIALPHARTPIAFLVLAALIYTCYGGGFGTLPSTAGRFFGVRHAGAIYGLMLIGWSIGGVVGPLLTAALLGETRNYTLAYSAVGAIALAAVALPLLTHPATKSTGATGGGAREASDQSE